MCVCIIIITLLLLFIVITCPLPPYCTLCAQPFYWPCTLLLPYLVIVWDILEEGGSLEEQGQFGHLLFGFGDFWVSTMLFLPPCLYDDGEGAGSFNLPIWQTHLAQAGKQARQGGGGGAGGGGSGQDGGGEAGWVVGSLSLLLSMPVSLSFPSSLCYTQHLLSL